MAYFVQNSSLIIFLVFVDIWSHLRINWQKLAQNRQKSHQKPQFPGKWSIFRKNESHHEVGN